MKVRIAGWSLAVTFLAGCQHIPIVDRTAGSLEGDGTLNRQGAELYAEIKARETPSNYARLIDRVSAIGGRLAGLGLGVHRV